MIVCAEDEISELLEKETKNILNAVDKIKKQYKSHKLKCWLKKRINENKIPIS